MQTLSVQIEDSYMQQFMHFVNKSQSKVIVIEDNNLALDPYFYERQKELQQTRAKIKNGTMEMLSEEQYEQEIEQFFNHIEK